MSRWPLVVQTKNQVMAAVGRSGGLVARQTCAAELPWIGQAGPGSWALEESRGEPQGEMFDFDFDPQTSS